MKRSPLILCGSIALIIMTSCAASPSSGSPGAAGKAIHKAPPLAHGMDQAAGETQRNPTHPLSPSDFVGSADSVPASIVIAKVDLQKQTILIRNLGKTDKSLTGWRLIDTADQAAFIFPKGYTLKAGSSVTITTGTRPRSNPPQELIWPGEKPSGSAAGPFILYDGTGRKVSHKE